jgi:hypothetical protein
MPNQGQCRAIYTPFPNDLVQTRFAGDDIKLQLFLESLIELTDREAVSSFDF